tara:strand:- start:481 stop:2064 length:1584 start_codon:yes stop_codon:yes gene_type:complete
MAEGKSVTKKTDIQSRTLGGDPIPFDVLKHIPEESAKHYGFVPIGLADNVLEVGIIDPNNLVARDALQFISSRINLQTKLFLITEADFKRVLGQYKNLRGQVSKALRELDIDRQDESLEKELTPGRERGDKSNIIEEAPVTKIVAVILNHATEGNASDIHVEPTGGDIKVKFRVDGALHTSLILPKTVHEAVVARVKILTNMKLDEKRKPQDGRFSAKIANNKIDFRVSTFPTNFGEKVVLRILDSSKGVKDIESIGLTKENIEILRNAINKPYGLILITGPTGSGKTTTLAAMMNELDREQYNVISLEDPVEYNIDGVNQSQVRPEINYTFASGLRSILRQDPDIIMVGEIRDKETAELAVQAALTGHLVLSTLHTNNAVGVIPRLVDMGIDPYLIGPTLILAVAQRLVKVICEDSKEELPVEDSIKQIIDKKFEGLSAEKRDKIKIPDHVYSAVRSKTCPGGTRGRIGVFEMIEIDKEIERLILADPSEPEIYKLVRSKGMMTMAEDALLKAFDGVIPFDQVNTV